MQIRLSIEKRWNNYLKLLFLSLVSLFTFSVSAQNTSLKGKIVDAKTFEAIPYVNIAVLGTTRGTMSGITGEFNLELPQKGPLELSVSSLGYTTQTFSVAKDTFAAILLEPTTIQFDEIVVKPDDTAYSVMKQVQKRKKEFSISSCTAQEYELYTKAMVIFRKFNFKSDSSLNTRFFRKEFKDFSVLSDEDKIPGLPGYMIESLSQVYSLKSPERVRRDVEIMNIEANVFNQTEMLDELINKQLDINMYDNQVLLFGKSFVSPFANSGKSFYKYVLADTAVIDGTSCIEIYFFPKQKDNLCFSGSLWLNDSSFVPMQISARTSLQTDINFVDNISIHQKFEPVDGVSVPAETRIALTGLNLLIDVLNAKNSFVLSQPKSLAFYGQKPNAMSDTNVERKLLEKREQYFSSYDKVALENLNKLSDSPKIKAFSKAVETSITGFYKTKHIDYGPWLLLLSSNEIEGMRLRLGANTTLSFSPKFSADGYLTYGFKDEQFKGALNTQFFFNKSKWGLIGARYGNDLVNIGTKNPFEQQDAFFALSSAINNAVNVTNVEQFSVYGQIDLLQNFTLKTTVSRSSYSPRGEDFVFAWYSDAAKTQIESDFQSTEWTSSLVYHPGNHYIVDGNRRFLTANNSSPIVEVAYTKGLKAANGDFSHSKVMLSLQQKIFATGWGYLNYLAAYEQTFGQAVYPLLNVLPGNETVWRSWTQFNLIDKGTVVADKLFMLRAEWHFEGALARKLPLVSLLDVRFVAGGNMALGSFNHNKNGVYDAESNPQGILSAFDAGGRPSSRFQTLNKHEPYAELYGGIENIFKIIRVDFIFRANSYYKDYASEFGVKISGRFGL